MGMVLLVIAAFMLIPLIVSYIYNEPEAEGMLLSVIVTGIFGFCGIIIKNDHEPRAKESLICVGLCWIAVAFIGALPFHFSELNLNFFDCFFESVSGFSTTGATIFGVVEDLPYCLLIWRALMQWLGGMGVIVFLLVLSSRKNTKSLFLMNSETTGPVKSKIMTSVGGTAKALYLMYSCFTAAEIIALIIAGMPVFDAFVHGFSTAGTGGFSMSNASVGAYNDACQIIITVFMFIFSISFSLYFLLLRRKTKDFLKSTEFKVFIIILGTTIALIMTNLMVTNTYTSFGPALKDTAFQVISVASTTGFSTVNFDSWPLLSKLLLLMLMFFGGMAGSTAGGMKISRITIATKSIKRDLKKLVHPKLVSSIRMDGEIVAEETISIVKTFIIIFFVIIGVGTLILSLDNIDFSTAFSAVLTSASNTGPGISLVGPACDFGFLSHLSKTTLAICMIAGRLEIFPFLLLFVPRTWHA